MPPHAIKLILHVSIYKFSYFSAYRAQPRYPDCAGGRDERNGRGRFADNRVYLSPQNVAG